MQRSMGSKPLRHVSNKGALSLSASVHRKKKLFWRTRAQSPGFPGMFKSSRHMEKGAQRLLSVSHTLPSLLRLRHKLGRTTGSCEKENGKRESILQLALFSRAVKEKQLENTSRLCNDSQSKHKENTCRIRHRGSKRQALALYYFKFLCAIASGLDESCINAFPGGERISRWFSMRGTQIS